MPEPKRLSAQVGLFDAEVAVGIYAGDIEGDWTGICELEPFAEDPVEIANAQLIKSAPDLLKALRTARAALVEAFNPGDHFVALIAIDAAIARAEGKEAIPV